jgi:beta-lactamase superfamily II metal-dependent hydrolase
MSALRVRVYNVLFGDAILVSVPDGDGRSSVTRHILIDVGNLLGGPGGHDFVFEAVVKDVLSVLDGRRLDLYVMTHEHLDHVQGLVHAAKVFGLKLDVANAWLTASADPGYYQRYPEAKRLLDEWRAVYQAIERYLLAAPKAASPFLKALLLNNDSRKTGACVDYLRKLARRTAYVHRGCSLRGRHPFTEAKFEIWGPERDTTVYYGRPRPFSGGFTAEDEPSTRSSPSPLSPPPGVDAGAFFDLVEARRQGYAENLLAIDRAANNTSIVLSIEWRGWRLLFPGDAERRSWTLIRKGLRGKLLPVHFLKLSHHGSQNGTPAEAMLDELFPSPPPDDRPRRAVVCTHPECYYGVPDAATLARYQGRCEVRSVEEVPPGSYLDLSFEG